MTFDPALIQKDFPALGRLVATMSFYVDDMAGPLLPGEVERARAWGQQLAARRVSR